MIGKSSQSSNLFRALRDEKTVYGCLISVATKEEASSAGIRRIKAVLQ